MLHHACSQRLAATRSCCTTWRFAPTLVCGVCVITLVGLVGYARYKASALPPSSLLGEHLPSDFYLSSDARDAAVILVLSESCGYSASSMPAVARLLSSVKQSGTNPSVIAITFDSLPRFSDYLEEHHIAVTNIHIDRGLSPLTELSPRLLLANYRGRIVYDSPGLITDGVVAEALTVMRRLQRH